jgi:secondary thiamine-phosphate synthase enzyme
MEKVFHVSTGRSQEIVDITHEVQKAVQDSRVTGGICLVYVPHATAAVMVNENADPNINEDILQALSALVPQGRWKHDNIDNNGAAHIKAAIIGPSQQFVVRDGRIVLGTWQSIMLADFDGPRHREVIVKMMPDQEVR